MNENGGDLAFYLSPTKKMFELHIQWPADILDDEAGALDDELEGTLGAELVGAPGVELEGTPGADH